MDVPVDEMVERMFEHHFFLSYAHRDDQPLDDEQSQGWVTRFRHTLAKRLGMLLGEDARPWWDQRKIRGNEDPRKEIADGLEKAAAFVPVLSPSYLKSDWCRRELEAFRRTIREQGLERLGTASRLFKVVKTPPPETPEALRNATGYDFSYHDPDSGRLRELWHGDAYLERIDDLAQDLCELLRKLSDPAADAAPATLYLAETAGDVEPQRRKIRSALKQRGVRVLPEEPLPLDGEELRERARDELAGCSLSVHLLGRDIGLVPEGERASLAAVQDELAAERARADPAFRRVIWLPPGLDPLAANHLDARQQAFLRHFYEDTDALRGAEIVQDSVEELENVLTRRLALGTGGER